MPWESLAVPWTPFGHKHKRLTYDSLRQRMVLGVGDGDGSSSGCARLRSWVPGDPTASIIETDNCRPFPDLVPAAPDNCIFCYIPQRDKILIEKGTFLGVSYYAVNCPDRTDTNVINTGMLFNLVTKNWETRTWANSPTGPGSDQNGPHFGVHDPVTNKLFVSTQSNWGTVWNILDLDTNLWTQVKMGQRFGQPQYDSVGSEAWQLKNCMAMMHQLTIDVDGRHVYMPTRTQTAGPFILRYNIDTGLENVVGKPMPAGWVSQATDKERYAVFDPTSRLLVIPHTVDNGGLVTHLYLCDVDNGYTWSEDPIPVLSPEVVRGNCWGYYPPTGKIVGCGASGLPGGQPARYFLYTPPGGGPPPPTTYDVRVTATPIVQTAVPLTTNAGQWKFTCVGVDNATNLTQLSAGPGPVTFTGLLAGTYDFRVVRLTDTSLEVGTAHTFRQTVPAGADNIEPLVVITDLEDAQVMTEDFAFHFEASDNIAITQVRAYISVDANTQIPLVPQFVGGITYEVVVLVGALADGPLILVAEGEDAVGNVGFDVVSVFLNAVPDPSPDFLMAATMGMS